MGREKENNYLPCNCLINNWLVIRDYIIFLVELREKTTNEFISNLLYIHIQISKLD